MSDKLKIEETDSVVTEAGSKEELVASVEASGEPMDAISKAIIASCPNDCAIIVTVVSTGTDMITLRQERIVGEDASQQMHILSKVLFDASQNTGRKVLETLKRTMEIMGRINALLPDDVAPTKH